MSFVNKINDVTNVNTFKRVFQKGSRKTFFARYSTDWAFHQCFTVSGSQQCLEVAWLSQISYMTHHGNILKTQLSTETLKTWWGKTWKGGAITNRKDAVQPRQIQSGHYCTFRAFHHLHVSSIDLTCLECCQAYHTLEHWLLECPALLQAQMDTFVWQSFSGRPLYISAGGRWILYFHKRSGTITITPHTVVWECCKDDQQSQWEMPNFGVC